MWLQEDAVHAHMVAGKGLPSKITPLGLRDVPLQTLDVDQRLSESAITMVAFFVFFDMLG